MMVMCVPPHMVQGEASADFLVHTMLLRLSVLTQALDIYFIITVLLF